VEKDKELFLEKVVEACYVKRANSGWGEKREPGTLREKHRSSGGVKDIKRQHTAAERRDRIAKT